MVQTVLQSMVDVTQVAQDVICVRTGIANVCMLGNSDDVGWVLVDGGFPGMADDLRRIAHERFNCERPTAIVLTHGHFDHVGAVEELISGNDVPVYAHYEEMPYLDGRKAYPPPNLAASSGLIAKLSILFPRNPVDLRPNLKMLPENGVVPNLRGWRWLSTPGHTPGHISLFRESDRLLIAGDAFTTVKQESAAAVASQDKEIHGPPAYFTPDWETAWNSVHKLDDLAPKVAVTGHGSPMSGDELRRQLKKLADEFEELAMPDSE